MTSKEFRRKLEYYSKYFKSFVSQCSEYQMEVLRSDSRFINILNFISNG